MMKNKKVFVITGATGVGKTTIARYLQENYHMPRIITHTTRPPRNREKQNIDYYFETPASFKEKHYLERVAYAGFQYGSSYEGLNHAWEKSDYTTIVLDTAGAVTYARELGNQAVILFITVAHPDTLIERVQVRGDNPDLVTRRITSPEFLRDVKLPEALENTAYVIKNDDWAVTKTNIDLIVQDVMQGRALPHKLKLKE